MTCSSLAFCREMQNKLAEDHSGWYYLLYPVLCDLYIYDQEFNSRLGREDDDTETKLYTKADVNARKKPERQPVQLQQPPVIR